MIKSKRGAIELSITTIVVVVIGITLLTLGLTFVYNIFQDIGQQQKQITSFTDEKIREIFAGSEDFINIPATQIKMKAGDRQIVDILVKNTEPSGATLNSPVLILDIDGADKPPNVLSQRLKSWFSGPGLVDANGNNLKYVLPTQFSSNQDKKIRIIINPTKNTAVNGVYTIPVRLSATGNDDVFTNFLTIEII